jgi:hypothetical protein
MTGSNLEYHIKAVITLKSMEDASSTTFTVTTIQESIPSIISWPIIKSVGSIGANMGDYLPQTSATSITLSNEYGSIGFERRFLDLLDRYTIINQQILIYLAVSAIGEFSDANYELKWAGTIKNLQVNSEDLVINIAGRGITDRVLNTIVTQDKFNSASEASLNYALPIIFGQNVQVKPLNIDSYVVPTQAEMAYGTNLRHYKCGGLKKAYAKGHDNVYHEIAAQASGSSASIALGRNYVAGKVNGGAYIARLGHRIDSQANGYVITGASVWIYKSAGIAAGEMIFRVHIDDNLQNATLQRAPGTILGEGVYQNSLLSAAAGVYEIRINFNKPIVIPPYTEFIFTHGIANETTGFIREYYEAVAENVYTLNIFGDQIWFLSNTRRFYWGVYALEIYDDNPYGSDDDNVHAQVFLYQKADLTEVPDLSKIDWVFEVDGLKDNSSGTVTGAANQLIESPQHIVELMTKLDNGTSYTGGQFGSEHSATWPEVNTASSRYYRKVAGKTQGATTLTSFLADICSATASRITMHPSTSTPLGYWAWGYTADAIDDITQEDCKIISGEIQGTESIVNAAQIFYADKLVDVDFITSTALGQFKSFSASISSIDTTSSVYAEANALTSVSRSIYGNLELQDKTNLWIADATSAHNMCLSYLRRYLYPSVYYFIEVPYLRYKALKLLDVVRITHPELAAFFGTTPDASRATYAATEVDLSTGFYWARANSTRAQIEGIQTIFDDKNMPRLRLTIKLLNNPADPT